MNAASYRLLRAFEGFAPQHYRAPPLHLAVLRDELIDLVIISDISFDQFAVRRHTFFSPLDGRQ